MRVLVDTSVWSAALRKPASKPESPVVGRLRDLIGRGDVVLSGLVLQEVLQGFKRDADFQKALKALGAFPLLQLDRAHYVSAAALRRACSARGVAASTVDCQIAASAIAHGCKVLTTDADFARIAQHSSLKLEVVR